MRKQLISDIETYLKEAIILYNQEGIVLKNIFFELSSRIFYLRKEDFDSKEKYDFFLRFYNQPRRSTERHLLENNFKDDNLYGSKFLWLCDYFEGIKNRLK